MTAKSEKSNPLDKLKAQRAALDEKIKRTEAKEREKERKRDTRRKIILGGLLMAEAEKKPETAALMERLIRKGVTRAIDRELFDLPPKAENGKAGDDFGQA
ncbi:MAG: mobilization protein [Pseudomonadota bacterium]